MGGSVVSVFRRGSAARHLYSLLVAPARLARTRALLDTEPPLATGAWKLDGARLTNRIVCAGVVDVCNAPSQSPGAAKPMMICDFEARIRQALATGLHATSP